MSISIRNAHENDVKAIASNIVAMALEINNEKLSLETVLMGVKKPFSNPESGFYIVAEMDGYIVGSLLITYEWSDWYNGNYWWIQSVYISPNYRNKGIYKAMYEYIKNIGDNAKAIKLYTDINNKTAQITYEKLGMKKSRSIIYYAEK